MLKNILDQQILEKQLKLLEVYEKQQQIIYIIIVIRVERAQGGVERTIHIAEHGGAEQFAEFAGIVDLSQALHDVGGGRVRHFGGREQRQAGLGSDAARAAVPGISPDGPRSPSTKRCSSAKSGKPRSCAGDPRQALEDDGALRGAYESFVIGA